MDAVLCMEAVPVRLVHVCLRVTHLYHGYMPRHSRTLQRVVCLLRHEDETRSPSGNPPKWWCHQELLIAVYQGICWISIYTGFDNGRFLPWTEPTRVNGIVR
jgi:hypothetical protein